jgi:plastocyanin
MRRAAAALMVLAIACAAAFVAPAGSAGSSQAHASAKHRCKHHHRKHRHKRCRKRSSNTTTTGGDGGSSGTSGPPGRLLATEKEVSATQLQLQLSRPSLAAGSSIVEQYNAGSDPHNLILEKDSQVAFAYPTLDPGGDQKQTIVLQPGTYTLYCSLLDHRSLGMQATLTVN